MSLQNIINNNRKNTTELDDYTCGLIIGKYQEGKRGVAISREMGIPETTVRRCIDRYEKTGTGVIQKRKGRPLKLSERDMRAVAHSFRQQPTASFVEHTACLKTVGIDLSRKTLSVYADRLGFGSYIPALVPKLEPSHIKKRLAWAKEKVEWTAEQWSNVIWSDESKFNLNGSDGRVRVIRKKGERFSPNHVRKSVKFGVGSVMIWGCFGAGGVGPLVTMKGSIDQEAYVSCLSNHFLPWLQDLNNKHPKDYIFQEDGASCHTGRYATWYKERCQIQGFDFWPPQSPDLNPIEHVWAYLEQRIESRRRYLQNIEQLEECLREEWYSIPITFLEALIGSMNDRCRTMIEANGGNTRY